MSANKYASDEINERITELLRRRRINTGYISDGRHTFGYYRQRIYELWLSQALALRGEDSNTIQCSFHESVTRCGDTTTLWGLRRWILIINGVGVVMPSTLWRDDFREWFSFIDGGKYPDPQYLILP